MSFDKIFPKTVTFSEYQTRAIAELPCILDNRHLDRLEQINARHKCDIFKISRKHLRTTQHVGFVRVHDINIQVLPKILDNPEDDLHFLLHLLRYTKKLAIKDFPLSSFTRFRDNFFEVLIWLYAKNLWKLLHYDIKRNYVRFKQQIPFVRGKLIINRQIRQDMVNRAAFHCIYDEFTESILLNQTFKHVSSRLLLQTKVPETARLLNCILFLLSEVQDRRVTIAHIDRIHFTRLNHEYKPLIDLCKIFLSGQAITLKSGKFDTFAFMFDMNRLFEEFVYRFLLTHKKQLQLEYVRSQKCLGKLFDEFGMYCDLLIKKVDGTTILIDTKYKTPDQAQRHFGLSQSDFYQMYAYSQSQHKKYENIMLLYPKATIGDHDFRHSTKDQQANLSVRSLDLTTIWDSHKKRIDEQAVLANLKQALFN